MNPARDESASRSTSRREWLIALALIGLGVAIRLWVAGHSAVEHFDEGVYASNLYFGEPPFSYPMQHLYAPPLLPSLIEAGMIAGLPPNVAAILPSLVAGCAMLVAVWRISRRWFGPAAGTASLALAALSDFHIAYSSTALTDVLLTLFVLLAVGAIARAIAWAVGDGSEPPLTSDVESPAKLSGKRRDRRSVKAGADRKLAEPALRGNSIDKWAVIAGLLTAAAWWTKYNGWLPLAIAVAGTAALVVLSPAARQRWQRLLLVLVLTAATAAIAWSPVPLGLEDVGGYSAVAANHAGYVVGPAGWLSAASRQIANQSAMEGLLSWCSIAVALACAWLVIRQEGTGGGFGVNYLALVIPGLLVSAAWIESTFVVLLVLSAATVAGQAMAYMRSRESRFLDESQIGFWLVAVWFGGLVVATPNYWPYPRLALPLLACLWLVAGKGLATFAEADKVWPATTGRFGVFPFGWIVAAGLLAALPLAYVCRAPITDVGGSLVLDRTGTRQAAYEIGGQIANDLGRGKDGPVCFIFVQAEPALVFQLRAAGFPFVQPVVAPPEGPIMADDEAIPTYFIYGPHASRDKQFVDLWRTMEAEFVPLIPGGIESRPSRVVRLDSNDPRLPKAEPERVWLHRRKEPAKSEDAGP